MELSTVEEVYNYLRELGPNIRVTSVTIIQNKTLPHNEKLSQGAVSGAINTFVKKGYLRIIKKGKPMEYEITSRIRGPRPTFYAKPIPHTKNKKSGYKHFRIPDAQVVPVTVPCPEQIGLSVQSLKQVIRNKIDQAVDCLINVETILGQVDTLAEQIKKINKTVDLSLVDDLSLARELKRRREGGLRINTSTLAIERSNTNKN